MNEEFEKFVLERQSTEHELMYGLKPEDWEWQLAAVAYLAGAAAGYTKGVATMRERCAEVVEIYVGKNEDYYCIEDITAAIREIGVE